MARKLREFGGADALCGLGAVDFFDLSDSNRDGLIQYSEYMAFIAEPGNNKDVHMDEDDVAHRREPPAKIEPRGADELRKLFLQRRTDEFERQVSASRSTRPLRTRGNVLRSSCGVVDSRRRLGGSLGIGPGVVLAVCSDGRLSHRGCRKLSRSGAR
eukprot:1511659-Rhodomonas_salina.2